MLIEMLTSIAGSITGAPGDVVDVDTATAERLIASDQARRPTRKTAEAAARGAAPETATAAPARPRRRRA